MAMLRAPGSLALAAAIAFAVILIAPGPARGCSCENTALSEYADDVAAAFWGEQIKRIEHTGAGWIDTTLVFDVHSVYKGQVGPLIEIGTQAHGATCGADFDGWGRTGVAAFEDDAGGLYVHWCGSHVSSRDLIEVFGSAYPPDETITLPENTDETSDANAATAATTTTSGAVETAAPPEEQGRGRARYAIPIFVAAVIMAGSTAGLLRRRRQEDGE